MATRILRSADDIDRLSGFLSARTKWPVTVTITQGASRSSQQNRLAQVWYSDVARQIGDMTHDEVRADCKVTFGAPILRTENEAFRQEWDATIGCLPHEAQRRFVQVLDVPVTRLMTVKQMTAFMDAMQRHWSGIGIRLTDPEAMKYEEEFV